MLDKQRLPALDAWQVLELELVAFPQDIQIAMTQNWWQELTDNAEVSSTRKRFSRTDEGQFQGRGFALSAEPMRVSWKASSLIDADNPGVFDSVPSAGSYSETRDWFIGLMDRWINEMCPPVYRLGFAGKFMLPSKTREMTYEILNQYLPSVNVEPDSFEFLYRINRKRPATTPITGLIINRLSTWSGVKISLRQLHANVSSNPSPTSLLHCDFQGCLLHVDINTDQDFSGGIPPENLLELWHELVGLATELAEHGDIR